MTKKNEKKRVYGVDFILETLVLKKKFKLTKLPPGWNTLWLGRIFAVDRMIFTRYFYDDGSSLVTLTNMYCLDGSHLDFSQGDDDAVIFSFNEYFTEYIEPNSVKFIKEE